nr:hypothetical protein CKG001_20010 [Bdellovibrio sp. CKG001]BFD63301.1 hypothetical protein BdHM001_19820 [Bdellovibrio sp. HM001]
MLQVIKSSEFVSMPWKNGQGMTDQIDLLPGRDLPYLWRLSSARVEAASPFSLFPGYDRLLAVFQGEGLLLNDRPLLRHMPVAFAGEEEIQCKLLAGPVRDLGLIYHRESFMATMVHEHIPAGSEQTVQTVGQTTFFFVSHGTMTTENLTVSTGDALKVQDSISLQIKNDGPEPLDFLQISITPRQNTAD